MNVEVCAVIVTYHPDAELKSAIEILRPQVGRLVVVDNHSSDATVRELRILSKRHNFFLIENQDNYGIGKALNQSIAWAKEQSDCEFVLSFDQDSFISETFVAKMVEEYRIHAESERIFLVIPAIVHRRTGAAYFERKYRGKYLIAQTSGSLMPIRIFLDERPYREDLFIDYVDYEFCLRAAVHGWSIAFCQAAVLYHNPGNIKQELYFGILRVSTMNNSPLRKYYLMRNGIWTIKTYGVLYPDWALDQVCLMLRQATRSLLFEKDRCASVRMWVRAVMDVLRSRFGALTDE